MRVAVGLVAAVMVQTTAATASTAGSDVPAAAAAAHGYGTVRLRQAVQDASELSLGSLVTAFGRLGRFGDVSSTPVVRGLVTVAEDADGDAIGRLAEVVAAWEDLLAKTVPVGSSRAAKKAPAGLDGPDSLVLHAATRAILVEIDHALPELAEHARTTRSRPDVAACDVVDQRPTLCVGGEGENRYVDDATLLIDLGGDDVYNNAAGAADPTDDGNGLQVSVNVDVDGNDRYVTEGSVASGARVFQGAATEGAVGILVDAAGDDLYSMTIPPSGAGKDSLGAVGQGVSLGGAGILADLGGDDTYRARSASGLIADEYHGVLAQGVTLGGQAVFADAAGNDSYVVENAPEQWDARQRLDEFALALPPPAARGFGVAGDGAALFVDGGGNDSLSLEAATARRAVAAVRRRFGIKTVVASTSDALAFGAATSGGVAVALFGDGDTRRLVEGARVLAYGASSGGNGGYGGLHDATGDDTYVARASEGIFATAATYRGVGVVEDRAGNDRYETELEVLPSRLSPEELLLLGESSQPGVLTLVSGVASQAAAITGAAYLRDGGGDDVYRVDSRNHVGASTTAAQAAARGNGAATLYDSRGSDSYSAISQTLTKPARERVPPSHSAQGSVDSAYAYFLDEDDGVKDRFSSVPEDPPCDGERGGEMWRDCGDGRGEGRTKL